MKSFNYANIAPKLFTPEVVNLIAAIHENKGKQDLFIEAKPDVLSSLLDIAKIQSTEASNKIEGIVTTEVRLKEIVQQKAVPRSRSEKEIAGYRDVLMTIHENYDYITPRANVILQLHRDLYAYSPSSIGGTYKNADNIIQETDAQGNKKVRFQPLPAFETPEAMEQLCDTFIVEVYRGEIDPLLLIPMFILDFLCIHPFNDGNGRMSRLLTLLLLYRSGYIVGKYISIEMLIEKTKDTYYDVIQQSGVGWCEAKNDYLPFVEYYLGIVLNAYREFSSRVELLTTKGLSKTDRVRAVIENKVGKITKKEIMELCPDVSQATVEKALSDVVKQEIILKIGGGRYTQYVFNRK
ncbi:MAG: Fic family protein [Christensenellaceae bacterium]